MRAPVYLFCFFKRSVCLIHCKELFSDCTEKAYKKEENGECSGRRVPFTIYFFHRYII